MPPPSFSQLDHISILATDPAASRRFYGDILGLREVAGPKTFDFAVIWYDLGKEQYLHLLIKARPDTLSPRHFALRVADAFRAREHLRQHGLPLEETTPIPGADRFFVRDPDGNRIEIIEWQRPYDPTTDGRILI